MTEEGPLKILSSIEAMTILTRTVRVNIVRTLETSPSLAGIQECLLKKNT